MIAFQPARTIVASQADVAVQIQDLVKAYKLYDRPFDLIKEAFTGRIYHRDKYVLTDISMTVGRGEVLGIIGQNGAGKSTLLKIIAGTLAPTKGTVTVNGRISAILELGTGFNPNYSGRDNVILSALMRGMSEEAIRRKFDAIVEFAGLEDVIDQPFHTYSSGMQARLAFAAAVSVEADVLIIDEALAAGDIRFASRSFRRIREICQSGVTALVVSHQTYSVMQLCSRVIWIDGGRIRMEGNPIDVVRAYEYEMHEAVARDQGRMERPVAVAKSNETAVDGPNEALSDLGIPIEGDAEEIAILYQTDSAGRSQAVTVPGIVATMERCPKLSNDIMHDAVSDIGHESLSPIASEVMQGPTSESITKVPSPGNVRTIASAVGASSITTQARSERFSTGQYRIVEIVFLDKNGHQTHIFRFGELLRLRVTYECLLQELPQYSCGLAVAFNRTSDFESVMYFNTNYAHSDDELSGYFDKAFRRYVGRRGVIEALIDPLQLRAGEYYVSLGILPNQPGLHEFYEYSHCQHRVKILANGFDEPAVFYPVVSWQAGPTD